MRSFRFKITRIEVTMVYEKSDPTNIVTYEQNICKYALSVTNGY